MSLCLCLKQAARSGYKVTRQLRGSLKSLMRSIAWGSSQKCRAYRKVSRAVTVILKPSGHQQYLIGLTLFPAQLKDSLPGHKDSDSWHQMEKNLPSLLQASSPGIEVAVTFARSVVCAELGPWWQGCCIQHCLLTHFLCSPYPMQNKTSSSSDSVALDCSFLLECWLLSVPC